MHSASNHSPLTTRHSPKWTDLSFFDTDILSVKARQAGYGLALCRDLFIHHFGTRTFSHGAPEEDGGRSIVRQENSE